MPLEATVELQFQDAGRQRSAATLGMWVFLATEVMFFGPLFAGYALYRAYFPEAFRAGSQHLEELLGTLETADLLTSSMFMALAVLFARRERRGLSLLFLALTAALGLVFLGIHGTEYRQDLLEGALPGRYDHLGSITAPGISVFFTCYWFMTLLHTFHVLIGVGVVSWMAVLTARRRFSSAYHTPVELTGLYWHFVDLVWIFLYPLFYLVGGGAR